MLNIRAATMDDGPVIRRLAEAIWWPTYGPILSPEQIDYMLELMYAEDKIREQIATGEQRYLVLTIDGKPMGFAAYAPRTENPEVYKLHKIYCLTNTKGLGYGKALLTAVENEVRIAGNNVLELNVNRHNPAVGFYEKHGFRIIYEEDIQIGNGYEMNDYVMQKLL